MAFDKSEFLSTFTDEAKDHLQKLNEGLLELEKKQSPELIEEMFREGHTLKGAARMMGFDEIKNISHCIEDIFGAIHTGKIFIDKNLSTLLFKALDVLSSILKEIIEGKEKDFETPWEEMTEQLKKAFEDYSNGVLPVKDKKKTKKKSSKSEDKENIEKNAIDGKTENSETLEELTFDSVKKELEEKGLLNVPLEDYSAAIQKNTVTPEADLKHNKRIKEHEIEEFIKVSVTKINKLLNLVGEMVINKINSNEKLNSLRRMVKSSRIVQKKFQDLSGFLINNPSIGKITNLDELKINLSEISNDIIKIKDDTTKIFDEISMEVSQLDPIVDELQLRMKQIRMLPIGTLFETMPRLVRDIAVAQDKLVDLHIHGEETELDKKVLESIKSSFIHLLRNSVDHGIENPADRVQNGKDPKGNINLRAYHKSGNVVIEVEDDGRGINLEKIKETAIRRGLISSSEANNLNETEILNCIFYPGFSTAPIITDISGRGVGLDVVKTDIELLKGNIAIDTKLGRGTKFTLQLPLTVAIIQALLVKCHNEIYAIPLLSVNESICIKRDELASIENRFAIKLRNQIISVIGLKNLLNIQSLEDEEQKDETFIVILNSIEKLLGIEVDEIIGEQEVFIKSIDSKLGKLKNVSGATVLGNGQVIVILDVIDLFDSSKNSDFHKIKSQPKLSAKKNTADTRLKKILIVEDSLTTRELERSILETMGYVVETSVDGLDALSKLQTQSFDLIVSDIQMPKMDGFELCKVVKGNPKLKDIPFIIVSALDKKEDKRRGIEVGAQAYIIKSAFDQSSLTDTIQRLIG